MANTKNCSASSAAREMQTEQQWDPTTHPPKKWDTTNWHRGWGQVHGHHTQLGEHQSFQTLGRWWHFLVRLGTCISMSQWPRRSLCPRARPSSPQHSSPPPGVRQCIVHTLWSIHSTDKELSQVQLQAKLEGHSHTWWAKEEDPTGTQYSPPNIQSKPGYTVHVHR